MFLLYAGGEVVPDEIRRVVCQMSSWLRISRKRHMASGALIGFIYVCFRNDTSLLNTQDFIHITAVVFIALLVQMKTYTNIIEVSR